MGWFDDLIARLFDATDSDPLPPLPVPAFCRTCGADLVIVPRFAGFDRYTGAPVATSVRTCDTIRRLFEGLREGPTDEPETDHDWWVMHAAGVRPLRRYEIDLVVPPLHRSRAHANVEAHG